MKRDPSGRPFFDFALAVDIIRAGGRDEVIEFVDQARQVSGYAARLECDLADERHRNETLEREAAMLKAMIAEATALEREACAKVCDSKHGAWRFDDSDDSESGPRDCAAAIRARGAK
jgi:hypothetical protein